MTASISFPTGHQHPAFSRLGSYLREITDELGIGLESCTVDHDTPVSAYVALDERLKPYPDRDVALLWDERHGWSVALEARSGDELIVLRYLDEGSVVPGPARVRRFVSAVYADDHADGRLDPPPLRAAGDLDDLAAALGSYRPDAAAALRAW